MPLPPGAADAIGSFLPADTAFASGGSLSAAQHCAVGGALASRSKATARYEQWKACQAPHTKYEASRSGLIRNGITKHVLAGQVTADGYHKLNMMRDRGGVSTKLVHRVVASAWIPPDKKRPVVDHVDGKRIHNAVKNLRRATLIENRRNRH